ncbi:DUF1566 domain-containing protein [Leptospira jelokensis]|uniref:DUF1566 domain-containing protein n=1 Tax=Leptospira jelokensis TaxID=2484931 RepID=A0A4Z0ZZS0_9LEPT|nr:DUF1566 domain-containing protein [Leptospira jelokensis]TGL66385.1 DUF1566 domain-containing protein [Leptospira jelokensis]
MAQTKNCIVLIFLFATQLMDCQRSKLDNLCDPKTESYLESLLIRYINFDETPHCGLVLEVIPPSFLNCPAPIPKPNSMFFVESFETDGNRLTFSSDPPLPPGISFSFFFNSLQGSYSGWFANRVSYTITASNPKGSASCTYTPLWMGKLPFKTNQTTCYDGAYNPAICSSVSGQDGNFQKGTTPSFIGPSLVAGVEITTEENSGLVWTSCQRGITGIGCTTSGTTSFTYTQAQTDCASLNVGSGFANRTDWRVPEMYEYMSTFDYTTINPSINQTYFPATDSWNFKTNTDYDPGVGAYYPTFIESGIGGGGYGDLHRLRCVANGTPIKNKRLINNNDGTILDLDTSLVWQRCHAGQTNFATCTGGTDLISDWQTAINYCQNLNLAGKVWRLPNANELRSLIDFYKTYGRPGYDPVFFPNTAEIASPAVVNYWTSTSGTQFGSNAFVVNFQYSGGGPDTKSNSSDNYTRCVSDF